MPHSTVTSKGQTTIPEKIGKALRIQAGDKLEYEGDRATIRTSWDSVTQGRSGQQEGKGNVLHGNPQNRHRSCTGS